MKQYLNALMAVAMTASMAACSNDDEPEGPDPDQPTVTEGVFVLNQGNYYAQIEGSLTFIDYATSVAQQEIFQTANQRSLGATPQGAVVYGGKIYIAVYKSNVIEIIDRNTYKSIKQISLNGAEGQSPRSLVAKDGKVYVSMYNGYVSRLDTLSLSIDKSVKVGPNPEIMAIKDNCLYVPNSDGLNWEVSYGNTASKIDLATFQVVKTFEVGLNPAEFATNGDDLLLLCKGNYADVPSTVYRISDNDESKVIVEATYFALRGNKLYYIYSPWDNPNQAYGICDLKTGKTSSLISDEGVESPAALGVDPINGNIIITSNAMDNGWPDYFVDGYAKVYDASGNFLKRYSVGPSPCMVFFNYK